MHLYKPKPIIHQLKASISNNQRILSYMFKCKTNLNAPHYEKVLIVDDALESRITIKKLLSLYNFQILEASDGLEAWKLIIREKPDLILLDLYMPNKDGFEILKEIKEEWLDIPVIILSGDNSLNTIDACLKYGASAFVSKPLIKEDFNNAIKTLCA